MRIAYFADSLPPNMDGVVNTFCHLVDTLETERIAYTFYSPFKPDENYFWHHRVRKVFSVPFFLYKDYRLALPYWDGLYRDLDRFNPQLVHVASPTLHGLYGLKYAQKRNLKAVTSYHTHFIDYFEYYGLSKMENLGWNYLRWFYNQFDRTYVPSKSSGRDLERRGIRGVELWQRGIETSKFSPSHANPELRKSIGAGNRPILLFVGRLVKEKDLDDLAAADRILKGQGSDHRLVVVGEGPMRKELESALPDAHFTGYQSGKALSEWYASSDVFVFPSTTETFGNVILEAFASGLPAVCARKGGVTDLVDHGVNGLLADPNNPADFATKTALLLKNPDIRRSFREAALATAAQYNWSRINKNLLRSYEDVLSNTN